MPVRITNNGAQAQLAAQVARGRRSIAAAQEQIASGKRINRPSDDPAGAGAVVRIRTSQQVVAQFQNVAASVRERLSVADGALNSHHFALDRALALLTKGASDTADPAARSSIAAELDGIRKQLISIANTRGGGEYVFGGTRQNAPPFDPATGAPAAAAASDHLVQLEPGASPVEAGVTAESVFADAEGTVMQALAGASAALRGTGDDAADQSALLATLDRLSRFADLARIGQVRVGVSLQAASAAAERLTQSTVSYEAAAERVEAVDFVDAALELKGAQQALDAAMQAGAYAGRRTLIDFLG